MAVDPSQIRSVNIVAYQPLQLLAEPSDIREFTIEANLARPATDYLRPRLSVSPLEIDDRLIWIDPAGYKPQVLSLAMASWGTLFPIRR
jgi:hypothetical protein